MKITNRLNLPQPFVSAVESDHKYKQKRYSVTDMLKGVREVILRRRHDDEIEEDVSDSIWLIFGSAVHSILENAQETDSQLKENKIVIPFENGYELSGIFDLYDDETGTVTDYKTASVWKVIFGDWTDYRTQTLIYCWMLQQLGFDAWNGEIVALLKDHSKTKAQTDYSYPNYPVYRIGWNFTDEELVGIESTLKSKLRELEKAEQLGDHELPLCTPSERFLKDEKWAVMKKGVKKAKRLFDSESEAEKHAALLNDTEKGDFYVEHRPGRNVKCLDYCSAAPFCDFYKSLVGECNGRD